MSKVKVIVTRQFEETVLQQQDYLENARPGYGRKFADEIDKATKLIETNPLA